MTKIVRCQAWEVIDDGGCLPGAGKIGFSDDRLLKRSATVRRISSDGQETRVRRIVKYRATTNNYTRNRRPKITAIPAFQIQLSAIRHSGSLSVDCIYGIGVLRNPLAQI